jgi:hypothetical protein
MSAGRTIICPDNPVFHEVLGDSGLYFTGDDFVLQLEDCLKHPLKVKEREIKIREISKEYTFIKKVKAISDICSDLTQNE